MGSRETARDRGLAVHRQLQADLGRAARDGRMDRALSQDDVGRVLGRSRSWVSLVERGLEEHVTLQDYVLLFSAIGQKLSVRGYPDFDPLRDAASVRLLERFRERLHPDLGWGQEVPMPRIGDLRAWDGMVIGQGPAPWRLAVEAETRPRDVQALLRRVQLKQQDSGVDAVLLLLLQSRSNRDLVRAHEATFREAFPVPGAQAMELLKAGVRPPGNALVLL